MLVVGANCKGAFGDVIGCELPEDLEHLEKPWCITWLCFAEADASDWLFWKTEFPWSLELWGVW